MKPIVIKRQLAQLRRLDPQLFTESLRAIRSTPHLAGVISAAALKAILARRERETDLEKIRNH